MSISIFLNADCYHILCHSVPPGITCPENFRIEESQNHIKVIEVTTSQPVNVTGTPKIGATNGTYRTTQGNVTWSLNGSDPRLTLGQNVSVAWNVSYVEVECSSVVGQPSVFANCSAIPTFRTCTTKVLKVSKLQKSLLVLLAREQLA